MTERDTEAGESGVVSIRLYLTAEGEVVCDVHEGTQDFRVLAIAASMLAALPSERAKRLEKALDVAVDALNNIDLWDRSRLSGGPQPEGKSARDALTRIRQITGGDDA